MIIKKFNTVLKIFQSSGVMGITSAMLKKIFPSGNYLLSWDRRILLELPCSNTLEKLNIDTRVLASSEVKELVGVNGQSEKSIESATQRGEACWAVMDNEVLAAYVWVSIKKIKVYSDTGYIFPVNGLGYWWRDVYVNPSYRGQGKLTELLSVWKSGLDVTNEANMYCEISPENEASIKSHQKNGFKDLGFLSMICILGLRIYHFSGKSYPRFSYRFYPKNVYYS